MPRNIELKFRHAALDDVRARAVRADADDRGLLLQTDTFFHCATGRLKLRNFGKGSGELIAYQRADAAAARASDYLIASVPDPIALAAVLTRACGASVVVRKRRNLLIWRNVRIHLDRVEGLGDFVELESVVGDVDEPTARANLEAAIDLLGLRHAMPVAVAYADLLAGLDKNSPIAADEVEEGR